MKALSPYLSQKINWSWEQLPESKFSMKLVFQNCLYSQTICQFLLNLLKLLGQSWPFMETQGKTMLRSFNLKKNLKKKIEIKTFTVFYKNRTVFRQSFFSNLTSFSKSIRNGSLSTYFQLEENSTMSIWILACVMLILFYFLFSLPFFFSDHLAVHFSPEYRWTAEGKFSSIQQNLEEPS